jgi:hypothetical protein
VGEIHRRNVSLDFCLSCENGELITEVVLGPEDDSYSTRAIADPLRHASAVPRNVVYESWLS